MEIVILCVGTNKVIADCFAPIVGEMLIKGNIGVYVYGNLKNTVNALNIDKYIEYIKTKHRNASVLVIDTRITFSNEIKVSYGKGPLEVAGLTLKRKIGHYHITLDIPKNHIKTISLTTIINKAYNVANKLLNLFVLNKKAVFFNNFEKKFKK